MIEGDGVVPACDPRWVRVGKPAHHLDSIAQDM